MKLMANVMESLQTGKTGHGDRLTQLAFAGPNPGALNARCYIPDDLPAGAPLVVVLHGCTQNAVGFDRGTGWSTLADRCGFALLFPEQVRANNPNLCFNWFMPGDVVRHGGEAESIAAMIGQMLTMHRLDRSRVFVTGLSAGGAMTAVMLAAYPELFAGGAIIGGLPYGTATGVPQALERMRGANPESDERLEQAVRKASKGHAGPWPTVSVWHGTADATVAVANMDGIGRQWRAIHGIGGARPNVEHGDGWEHRSWTVPDGRVLVEEWRVAGMGHGVPLDPQGSDALGQAGAFMLDAGIASTAVIARSWGLLAPMETRQPRREGKPALPGLLTKPKPRRLEPETPRGPGANSVQTIIEDALRTAGLMR